MTGIAKVRLADPTNVDKSTNYAPVAQQDRATDF